MVVCVLVYLGVFSWLALRGGNLEFGVYAGAMVVYIALVLWLDRRFGLRRGTLWLLAAWGFVHMAGGTVPAPAVGIGAVEGAGVLYGYRVAPWLPRYDQVVHAVGFFAASLACFDVLWSLAGRAGSRMESRMGLAVCAALMGCGLGALNEVLEFWITLVLPEHNVGGYVNTGWDLVSNLVGCVAAAVVVVARRDGR